MTFYTDPAFFVLLAAAVVVAVVLGCCEKRLRAYGFAASVVFVLLLFSKDLYGLAAFGFYLVLATTATMLYLRSKSRSTAALRSKPHHEAGDGSAPEPASGPSKHAWPAAYPVAMICVIAPLVIYKIGAVFDQNLLGFLGISYITFKAVQVVIEIHDGLIKELSLLDYLYLLIFFPSFTSGPILRSRPFVEDVHRVIPRVEYLGMLEKGAVQFVIGAFYKFVCSSVFSIAMWFIPKALGDDSTAAVVLGQIGTAYAYGLYLFFDFAGYSLMAIGVGAAFGVQVPANFRAPFLSVDIKDFWNRWHITLSFWLRDFVFMRVVRIIRRRKLIKTRLTCSCVGYIVNMGLMGFWHGITPNYIAYGFYHGILLALNEVFQKSDFYKKHKDGRVFKVCSWAVTMNLVFFGFALFSGQVPIGL